MKIRNAFAISNRGEGMHIIKAADVQTYRFSRDESLLLRRTVLSGELLVCPTESSYLLGGNAFDTRVIAAVYAFKDRPERKPLPIVVNSREQAETLADFPAEARCLADAFWPGPLTLVLPAKPIVPAVLSGGSGTIGMRVPDFPLLRQLLDIVGVPLISTSANLSGHQETLDIHDFIAVIRARTAPSISVIIDGGRLPRRLPSTVVEIRDRGLLCHREGSLPLRDVQQVFQDHLRQNS